MPPRPKHWHLTDYIIARTKDVRVTTEKCSADYWADHRLIVSKRKVHIQPIHRPQGQKVAERLNTSKLKLPSVQHELAITLESQLNEATGNAGRGTIDMVFAARQLQEKSMEQHQDLYMTFVDLTKVFDTVNREGLWNIMSKSGCPDRFVKIVWQLHEGIIAQVLDDGNASNSFPVTNRGVTKVKDTVIRDLRFADDCALNANNEQKMQLEMDGFSTACDNFGLTISTKKTEVMSQSAPGNPYQEHDITVKGKRLHIVKNFT
ncbi:PREDICTED: uncharacterized protein LOC107349716 [Acropora digitifera]|uniref:uncharacterized protein LOC107349716 n=1 Tax=Acropora digitifera TaxID=70779 RepID=UPI00077A6C7D|nr:PREDICTED: uncharacterized protein LOC107349716 [Acropora digitifera]